jgi:hypothetical protein
METTYVSPMKYQNYNCSQIAMEMDHVSNRTVQLHNSLDKKASDDAAQMGLGLLFWPALFFLEGGDGPEAAEYSKLKGEYEALRTASVQKECAIAGVKSPEEIVIEKQQQGKSNEKQAMSDDF